MINKKAKYLCDYFYVYPLGYPFSILQAKVGLTLNLSSLIEWKCFLMLE
jgi:hypothetical protein